VLAQAASAPPLLALLKRSQAALHVLQRHCCCQGAPAEQALRLLRCHPVLVLQHEPALWLALLQGRRQGQPSLLLLLLKEGIQQISGRSIKSLQAFMRMHTGTCKDSIGSYSVIKAECIDSQTLSKVRGNAFKHCRATCRWLLVHGALLEGKCSE